MVTNNPVNSQYFSAERVQSGAMMDFVNLLLKMAYEKDADGCGTYNDVHIYPQDLGAFTVEWAQVPWAHDYGGQFQYIDEDQVVLFERSYPDGTYDYFASEDEYKEALDEWLSEHPGYHRNQWGMWTCDSDEASPDDEDDGEGEPAEDE